MREILRHCSQRETPQRNDTGALVNIVGYLGTTKSNLPTNPGPRHLVAAIPDEHDMDIVAN